MNCTLEHGKAARLRVHFTTICYKYPSILIFLSIFIKNIEFCKSLVSMEIAMWIFSPDELIYHMNRFPNFEPTLHSEDKSHSIMRYYSYVVLDAGC